MTSDLWLTDDLWLVLVQLLLSTRCVSEFLGMRRASFHMYCVCQEALHRFRETARQTCNVHIFQALVFERCGRVAAQRKKEETVQEIFCRSELLVSSSISNILNKTKHSIIVPHYTAKRKRMAFHSGAHLFVPTVGMVSSHELTLMAARIHNIPQGYQCTIFVESCSPSALCRFHHTCGCGKTFEPGSRVRPLVLHMRDCKADSSNYSVYINARGVNAKGRQMPFCLGWSATFSDVETDVRCLE